MLGGGGWGVKLVIGQSKISPTLDTYFHVFYQYSQAYLQQVVCNVNLPDENNMQVPII